MTDQRLDRGPRSDVAAVPLRALQDSALREQKGPDLRVLGVIACHDRSTWGGPACWETADHLAELIGYRVASVRAAIARLIAAGYLREPDCEPSEWRTRGRRPLCVVYDDSDWRALERGTKSHDR